LNVRGFRGAVSSNRMLTGSSGQHATSVQSVPERREP